MNTRLIIIVLIAAVVFVGIFVGVLLLLDSGGSSPQTAPTGAVQQPVSTTNSSSISTQSTSKVPQSAQSEELVKAVFLRTTPASKKVEARSAIIIGEYALVGWVSDPEGGEALLVYDEPSNKWVVTAVTGGAFGVAGLHKEGVPQRIVLGLLHGLD